jgi:PKHD-type hydroxylase
VLAIGGALDAATLEAIRERLTAEEHARIDGRATANGRAREAKHNEQLAPSAAGDAVTKLVAERLRANPVFAAYARPRDFPRLQVSRYGTGMRYDWHVDAARIAGMRTDLSFTCFLSEKQHYEGGELVIAEDGGERHIRLEAGDCFVYPASTLHRVNPVTRGERWAVVGWVRSEIRDGEQRRLLYDLDNVMAALDANGARLDLELALAGIRGRLQRMWMEG